MEDHNMHQSSEGSVSDALFGTSSDAIIQGLHQGILQAQQVNDGDKNQIVNEQDQNEVTNTLEGDQYNPPSTAGQATLADTGSTSLMSKDEAQTLLSENNHLDETGDSEAGVFPENEEIKKLN